MGWRNKQRRNVENPPKCWTPGCVVKWPCPVSSLCGYCRAAKGLPSRPGDPAKVRVEPKEKPVYRLVEELP